MKTVEVTDEWLYRYMPIADEAMIREIESKVDTDYEFSDRFCKRMKRLCRREKYMDALQFLQKAEKRVAVVVLMILISLLTATMSVEAYRVRFFEKVKEFLGDMYRYSYQSEEKTEFQKRIPSYVPDGYELISNDGNAIVEEFVYQNNAGQLLVFRQEYVVDGMDIYFDSEYDWEEQHTIAGSQLEIHRYKTGFASAYFEYGECVYTVSSDEYLSGKVFCRIIQEWIE